MDEMSDTFAEVGLPGGLHAAAPDIFHRITHFKAAPAMPSLEDVLAALIQNEETAQQVSST